MCNMPIRFLGPEKETVWEHNWYGTDWGKTTPYEILENEQIIGVYGH